MENLYPVTIIDYDHHSTELKHHTASLPKNPLGRIIISEQFKAEKSVIVVCSRIKILKIE